MSGKNFKDLLENANKTTWSHKILSFYKESKKFQFIFAAFIGGFCTVTFLNTYPGKALPMQSFFKSVAAKTFFELHYLSTCNSEALALDTTSSWTKVMRTAEGYALKLGRDVRFIQRIEYWEFYLQCFGLVEKTLDRSKDDKSFFFFSLRSLGVFLDQLLEIAPGFSKNQEIRLVLMRVLSKIKEHSQFKDRLKETFSIFEWNSFFNLFLIVCRFGNEEKIEGYKCLKQVVVKHQGLLDVFCEDLVKERLFRDCVDLDKDVRTLALDMILVACESERCRECFVKSRLVFNLYTRVLMMDSGNHKVVTEIVQKLTSDRNVWQIPDVAEEKERVVLLALQSDDQDLKKLVELIR